jgi:hypothetical protein
MSRSAFSISIQPRSQSENHPSGVSGGQALHALNGACGVCGSTSVEVDEVSSPVRMRLSECTRCEHRWTQTLRSSKPRAALRTVRTPLANREDSEDGQSAEVALAS